VVTESNKNLDKKRESNPDERVQKVNKYLQREIKEDDKHANNTKKIHLDKNKL